MWARLGTYQERVRMTNCLKKQQPIPDDVLEEKRIPGYVMKIVYWLTSLDPTDRPTASQLQTSELLP